MPFADKAAKKAYQAARWRNMTDEQREKERDRMGIYIHDSPNFVSIV